MNFEQVRKKWLGWKGLVLVGVLVAAGWGIRVKWFSPPPPPQVITAEVVRQDLEDAVLANGTIKAIKQVNVGAQVSGQVKKLHVALGDKVKAGQLVAEIDATTQTNVFRNAEAALLSVQAQRLSRQATVQQAELNFRRQQELIAVDATSRQAFEQARAAFETAKADVAVIEAQIEQTRISVDTARVNLGYTRIVAPMDGTVVAVVTEEGRTVNAVQAAPTIIKVAQLDTVTITAEISEADVVRVRPDMPVYFTILGEQKRRHKAVLRSIEPVPLDQQKEGSTQTTVSSSTNAVYFNAQFDVANPEGKFRPGMTAQVSVVLRTAADALSIPAAALGERGKGGVFTVRVLEGEGPTARVVDRSVKVGLNNRVNVEVLEGLKEGEQVVTSEAKAGESGSVGMPAGRRPGSMF